jgi:hypothetical protein
MSGTATLERKGGSAVSIPGIEHKAATVTDLAPQSGVLAVDEETGLVTAIVSVTGIVDNVDDRILPGAYTKTLKTRRPKGVWSHDWKDWVSRTEAVEEYLPGDPRLPAETKDGQPWPKEAGALVVTTRFNMESTRCVEAFKAVKFFSETGECEWSIGYVVPPGQATKDSKGVRNIKSLDLFEYGPVLFGAASQSMTLSVKSLSGEEPDVRVEIVNGLGGSDLGVAEALADGSFRVKTKGDLAAALRAYPRAADRLEAKVHIVGRALALDATDLLPEGWLTLCQSKGLLEPTETPEGTEPVDPPAGTEEIEPPATVGDAEETLTPEEEADLAEFAESIGEPPAELQAKMDTSPVGTPGGKQNWVDKVGGLPAYIRAIAHALIRNGKSESHAIAIAIATVKRWAAGEGKTNADTKAKAAKALAEWEAKKAASHATKSLMVEAYDPTVEVKAAEPVEFVEVPLESKMYGTPQLPGSYEARRQAVREAVSVVLRGEGTEAENGRMNYEWNDVDVQATFDDHVIATRFSWDGPTTTNESFEVPYTMDDATGLVSLGEPRKVRLNVVTVVEDDTTITPIDGFSTVPDMVDAAAEGVKALLAATQGQVETKAGKVLSGANEARLRAAAEHLFAVLRAAGIAVEEPGKNEQPIEDPTVNADTTAPSGAAQAAATGGAAVAAKDGIPEGLEQKAPLAFTDPAAYLASLKADLSN